MKNRFNENYSKKILDSSTGDLEDLQTGYNCITGGRAAELLEMAIAGEVPGANYSDYEVSLWSAFKTIINTK